MLRMRTGRFVWSAVLAAVLVASGGTAGAATGRAGGYVASDFVTNLPTVPPPSPFAGVGPVGLIFDPGDHLLVSDAANQGFYSFGPAGSSAPNPITTGNVQTGLAFAKDGQLFSPLFLAGNIDQIDPVTGALIRRLNPPGKSYPCVGDLATDPVSGDLFFGQSNSGGVCPGNAVLTRVENPTSTHPTFVNYSSVAGNYYIGLAFAPDGTLYAVQQGPSSGCAVRITGTSSPQPPTITTLACFPNFGQFVGIVALTLSAAPRGEPVVFVAGPAGTITKIDQSTTPPTLTPIVTLPTLIDGLAIGPDGCLYATQSTAIEKVTPRDGRCRLVPATVLPSLRLRPDTIDSAVIGSPVTLRATLANDDHPWGRRITFTVTGANPTIRTVTADGSGRADFSYRGIHSGADTITATATIGSTAVASNPSTVQWNPPAPAAP